MNTKESKTLPPLGFMGGTKALTLTPIVGTPKWEYAESFVPGEEPRVVIGNLSGRSGMAYLQELRAKNASEA